MPANRPGLIRLATGGIAFRSTTGLLAVKPTGFENRRVAGHLGDAALTRTGLTCLSHS